MTPWQRNELWDSQSATIYTVSHAIESQDVIIGGGGERVPHFDRSKNNQGISGSSKGLAHLSERKGVWLRSAR